jgi:DNA-binding PadR family transcriptional regulator
MMLEFLNRVYPSMVIELDIIGVFYRDYRDSNIRKALSYLVDKGYVEAIKKPHPVRRYDEQVLYKITPKGIDLLDGTENDNGILLEDRE